MNSSNNQETSQFIKAFTSGLTVIINTGMFSYIKLFKHKNTLTGLALSGVRSRHGGRGLPSGSDGEELLMPGDGLNLIQEDLPCHGATKPMSQLVTCVPEPELKLLSPAPTARVPRAATAMRKPTYCSQRSPNCHS